tara:strand:+ start:106 stop:471 length:366 start_codon:yes stop_codon:yes gene_type:complete
MKPPIRKNRKKHARSIRKGVGNKIPGGIETHRMVDSYGENKKGKKVYYVTPSITFDKKGKVKPQSIHEAAMAGELYLFKKEKAAKRFAAGSWKKGKAKRKAMSSFRKKEKQQRINRKNNWI